MIYSREERQSVCKKCENYFSACHCYYVTLSNEQDIVLDYEDIKRLVLGAENFRHRINEKNIETFIETVKDIFEEEV